MSDYLAMLTLFVFCPIASVRITAASWSARGLHLDRLSTANVVVAVVAVVAFLWLLT